MGCDGAGEFVLTDVTEYISESALLYRGRKCTEIYLPPGADGVGDDGYGNFGHCAGGCAESQGDKGVGCFRGAM